MNIQEYDIMNAIIDKDTTAREYFQRVQVIHWAKSISPWLRWYGKVI